MRIAFVCRELADDSALGAGAQVLATALAVSRLGHEVVLVSETLCDAARRRLAGLRWAPTVPERPRHWYFTEQHSFADRVYDTLRDQARFDAVEFVDTGGEGLTTVRAKRLLGQFPETCLAVDASAGRAEGPDIHHPVSFPDRITRFAERYVRDHADLILASGTDGRHAIRPVSPSPLHPPVSGTDGPVRTDRRPDAARTVLWLGRLGPESGLHTMLAAAERALDEVPDLRVVVCGDDTMTDPFGRSYAAYLRRRMAPALRDRVTFASPPRLGERLTVRPGTQCVLPADPVAAAAAAWLAMASGCAVIAPADSVGAGLIRPGETGRVVPARDAAALAAAILDGVREPDSVAACGEAAARDAWQEQAPVRAAELRVEAYRRARPVRRLRGSGPPGARDLVSVVIPVHNQGRFLPETLASVRSSAEHVDLDVVVVDDGSTDVGTVAAIDALAGVTTVRQENRGLAAARNVGLAACSGRFVLVLDADDLVHPQFLPAALGALRRCAEVAFVGGYVRYFGLLELTYVPVGPVPELNLVLQTHYKSMGLYRRDVLTEVGGYDEDMPAFEDWEIQLRLAREGYGSDILPIEGQQYRRHAESMSFTTSNGMRTPLVQYLVGKHRDMLGEHAVELIQTLVELWKSGYEPSTSVLLQRTGR